MKIGTALPSNVLRLEYDEYIKENFGLGTLDFDRGGFVMLDRTSEHVITGTKLRSLWSYENYVIESENNGIFLHRPAEDIPHLKTFSDLKFGWWKAKIMLDGVINASRNEIRIIEYDSNNYVFIELGDGNSLKVRKRTDSVFGGMLDPSINLEIDTWYDIEVTYNELYAIKLYLDGNLEASTSNIFTPTCIKVRFENYSSVGMYVKEFYAGYSRPD